MENMYAFLKFLHVLTVVFMAAPLYSLIIVNERALFMTALLGLQVSSPFPLLANAAMLVLAALFSWRAFKKPLRFGWW